MKPVPEGRAAEITRLLSEGQSLTDVGRAFGLSRERVRQIASREKLLGRWDGMVVRPVSGMDAVSEEKVQEIVRLHTKELLTPVQVAQRTGHPEVTVRQVLAAAGATIWSQRLQSMRKCPDEKLIALYQEHRSCNKVARLAGISAISVHRRLTALGLVAQLKSHATEADIRAAMEGRSLDEAARELGYSRQGMTTACERLGIEYRGPGKRTLDILRDRLARYERLYGPLPKEDTP